MKLVKYKPYHSLVSLSDEMDRWFNDFGLGKYESDVIWSPVVDLSENDEAYEVKAEIPGMDKKDIRISLEDHVLTISGEKKKEDEKKEDNYHRIERVYGKFQRSFRLPKEIKGEEIKASYKDGVLYVSIPKSEKLKPKEIEIK